MKKSTLLIDGHVHIYTEESVRAALDAASRNFNRQDVRAGSVDAYGLLLLADPINTSGFSWICGVGKAHDQRSARDDWRIVSRPDSGVVHLAKKDCIPIAVLGGHQLITSEGLEVLAFPMVAAASKHDLLATIVKAVSESGGLAIIPWGVGKWLGARGKAVKEIVDTGPHRGLAFGDNGGRPRFWRRVRLLDSAKNLGHTIFPGSDPFALRGEVERIGSYGGVAQVSVNSTWTSIDFLNLLQNCNLQAYGELLSFPRFTRNQIALRLNASNVIQ